MSKKHRFDEDTKKEAFTTPPGGVEDPKVADDDVYEIEIEIDDSEVEEEADRRTAGANRPETD